MFKGLNLLNGNFNRFTDRPIQPWIDALKAYDSAIDVYLWPNETDLEAVELVLCWKHPQGVLQRYPNLRCICSMGAGVDHLLKDPQLPQHIPVARLIDPLLKESMFDYVSAVAMHYFCRLDVFNRQQESFIWHEHGETAEVFVVIDGEMSIEFRDGVVTLKSGEMFVVPRGVEHKSVAEHECKILLIEPKGTLNTGSQGGDRTVKENLWV